MSDPNFFSTTKKGEIAELKDELNDLDRQKRKEAVKKVIAAMTVGKDVSMLFPDVINCIQTENLELKKLVYLYLINYSKSQPDLAIMAVNTFVKDTQDPNPLIRALAVRTMGCIRVDKITEYLCDPLERRLKDEDPYVRKTAAICVAKLYDISPELVQDRGFLDTLRDLLSDANPMVVANAVAALAEIQDSSAAPVFQLSQQTVVKLLAALNECTEWGQVFILDALVRYNPKDSKEAESTIERVTPRLQHANSAVVLSAVKVILKQMDMITLPETIKALCKKMAPPLVTLLSAEPEIQYVALRNINLIIQKRPSILQHEIKVFFCKYNDPIYVKMEKLEIMIKLASDRNIDQVLLELKEYATEVDVEFVRKSVRAIGRCAITLERAAERCINVLLELIQTKVNYVVQEAIVVIKDIFRRYPNTYESIIATLCENLDTLDEPEAKSSMIWIIGEYAERIENADELLEAFLETFSEENSMVQLQLLTGTVKLFLKNCTESSQRMIQEVLNNATQETDNPDLRDRAFIYWRLLSTDPEAAKDVVLAEKPTITDDTGSLEGALLNQLLGNISMLSSVYHKPPEAFVSRTRMAVQKAEDFEEPAMHNGEGSSGVHMEPESESKEEAVPDLSFDDEPEAAAAPPPPQPQDPLADLLGLDVDTPQPQPAAVAAPAQPVQSYGGMDDLLGLGGPATTAPTPTPAQPAPAAGGADDFFGGSFGGLSISPAPPSKPVILDAGKGNGLEICGKLIRSDRQVFYDMTFTNKSPTPRDGFMIQFNKNTFGLTMAQPLSVPPLQPNQSADTKLPMAMTGAKSPPPPNATLQIAIKDSAGVYYCSDNIAVEALFQEDGKLDANTLKNAWTQIPDANKKTRELQVSGGDPATIQQKLGASNVFFVLSGPNSQFFSLKMDGNIGFIIELASGLSGLTCNCKSPRLEYAEIVFDALQSLLA